MDEFLFTYRNYLKDEKNDSKVYEIISSIIECSIVDSTIKKQNIEGLKQLNKMGEELIAVKLKKSYPSKF